MNEQTKVLLELPSTATNVALVRSVVTGFSEVAGLDPELSDRLRTAISEAANNVVLHAYDDTGEMRVVIATDPERVDVSVADDGHGIRPVVRTKDRMGLGLPMIGALADKAEFLSSDSGGTEVRLAFTRGDGPPHLGEIPDWAVSVDDPETDAQLSGDMAVRITPTPALGRVLGRLSRAVAAQYHFRVDTLAKLRKFTDSLAAEIDARAAGRRATVGFALTGSERRIELRIGPLDQATADALALRVAENPEVEHIGDQDYLHVVITDPR
ncbi:MAG: ATP-binding protein [Solirubrobacterales bacterium]|nr:ATP-binding protein [Solirubrobacterales bacterium]